ncbi:MAG: outer membrane beta-barrel protein [Myxococcota bacterium]
MRGLVGAVVVVVLGYGAGAKADAKSWFAYGVNTSLGMRQNSGDADGNTRSVASTFGIQLKFLRFLGVELGYSPFGSGADAPVRFDNPWNASALLYIVPTSPVGAYLKGGVGNSSFARIFDVDGQEATYHGGAGLEVYVTDHLVLGGEFLFLTPGARTIIDGLSGTNDSPRAPDYYVAPSNFRASFRVSYFF